MQTKNNELASKRGRPLSLPDKRDAIISNLNMGITLKTACEYAGIDYQTFTLWRRRGEAALQKQQSGFSLDEKENLYAEFVLDVTEAKSKLLVMLETQLVNKVKNNEISAKNIIHMLERLDRSQWGRVDTINVNNTDAALDEHLVIAGLSRYVRVFDPPAIASP